MKTPLLALALCLAGCAGLVGPTKDEILIEYTPASFPIRATDPDPGPEPADFLGQVDAYVRDHVGKPESLKDFHVVGPTKAVWRDAMTSGGREHVGYRAMVFFNARDKFGDYGMLDCWVVQFLDGKVWTHRPHVDVRYAL